MDENVQTMTPDEVRQMLDLLRKGKAQHDRQAAEARVMSKPAWLALAAGEARIVGIDRVTGALLVQPIVVESVEQIAKDRAEKWQATLREIEKANARDKRITAALAKGEWTSDLDNYVVSKHLDDSFIKSVRGNQLEAIVSSRHTDRMGDVVEPDGWDLSNYMKNPVLLENHDYAKLPVGKCLDVAVQRDALVARFEFAGTARGQEVAQLYREGVMRAFSVGFRPLKWEPIKGGGVRYLKQELLEISAVGVPANQAAVVTP